MPEASVKIVKHEPNDMPTMRRARATKTSVGIILLILRVEILNFEKMKFGQSIIRLYHNCSTHSRLAKRYSQHFKPIIVQRFPLELFLFQSNSYTAMIRPQL